MPNPPTFTPQQRLIFESLNIPYVCLESKEVEVYDTLLRRWKPRLCLEWGAGYSTIYFPSQHPYVERWIAIEHDPAWFGKIVAQVPSNVDLRLYDEHGDGYIFDVFNDELRFDFISIDGRRRGECMLAASILVKKEKGWVFLHDTGRPEYSCWFGVFDHSEKLTDGLPAEQNPHGNAGRGLYKFWND